MVVVYSGARESEREKLQRASKEEEQAKGKK
jgi:hypothetical protein